MDITPLCTLSEHSFCLWLYFRAVRTDPSNLPNRPPQTSRTFGRPNFSFSFAFSPNPSRRVRCASPHARCSGSHPRTRSRQAKHLSRYAPELACLRASKRAALYTRSPCGARAEPPHLPAASGDRAVAARGIAAGEGTQAPPRPRDSPGCGLRTGTNARRAQPPAPRASEGGWVEGERSE